jgi:hypothetical protein
LGIRENLKLDGWKDADILEFREYMEGLYGKVCMPGRYKALALE